jgi:hypothetical protein
VSGALPRPTPCASCPYRRNVPSGLWEESEYAKLPGYDGEMLEQRTNVFGCHQADGSICAGWLGHREHPTDLLAVRLGVSAGVLDESCASYETDVDLFESGAEAAEHGCREIENPSPRTVAAITKLLRTRGISS